MIEFQAFPKITRYLNVEFTITEKIDGTNAAFNFDWDGTLINVQSRTRFITEGDDNYGFAKWVTNHSKQLFEFFGEGLHFGEWWGSGIQKRYGAYLPKGQKFFTPFNVGRFGPDVTPSDAWPDGTRSLPVLASNIPFVELPATVEDVANTLITYGSVAVPGAQAEGIMIWSQATGYIKHPFDDGHKWQQAQ